jgi:hypothetical protein
MGFCFKGKQWACFAIIISSVLGYSATGFMLPAHAGNKPTTVVAKPTVSLSAIELVKTPKAYLGKPVVITGKFSGFTALGLDYKPALRDAKTHVGLLLFRPDVGAQYKIPLSELKLFIARKESERLPDLEPNDEVELRVTLFSDALGDAWGDVTQFKVLQKAPKKQAS